MNNYPSNQERTEEYRTKFDREKVLKYLIKNPRPVIFDVGANIGTSLDEFKAWWPGSSVHCFEPQQECWESLDERSKKYTQGGVSINRCAAGNVSNDRAAFFTHAINSGVSGFNKINLQSLDSIHLNKLHEANPQTVSEYEQSLNHQRNVQLMRLDEYILASSVNHVNLLKIDTQGHEPEVLEGLGSKLSDIDVVITELMFYDYYERSLSFSDIERFLLPAGFRLYDISHIAKNPMNGRTDWADVIYVNQRIREGFNGA